jgi:hypothetical protein
MSNRNITLSLPSELIRRAKVVAAQRETSISAMVATLLRSAVGDVEDHEQVWAEEARAMDAGILKIGEVTWTRDDLYDRSRG